MKRNFTKVILKNNIRIYLSDFQDVVNQILEYHKYLPLPSLILANAICAFSPLKYLYNTNNLMVRIKNNGAMKTLILEIKFNQVRALISNPNIETEFDKNNYNDIPLILGIGDHGILEVSREVQGEFFNSETPLAKADIVTDLAYFLNQSDQTFSAVVNDVSLSSKNHNHVQSAKNIIFQLLPNHKEEDKIWIENFVKNNSLKDYSIEEIEKKIDGKLLLTNEIEGTCWCSYQKILNAINLLSLEEKNDLFKDVVEVKCEFCQIARIVDSQDVSFK